MLSKSCAKSVLTSLYKDISSVSAAPNHSTTPLPKQQKTKKTFGSKTRQAPPPFVSIHQKVIRVGPLLHCNSTSWKKRGMLSDSSHINTCAWRRHNNNADTIWGDSASLGRVFALSFTWRTFWLYSCCFFPLQKSATLNRSLLLLQRHKRDLVIFSLC